jgi:hypothetical protein
MLRLGRPFMSKKKNYAPAPELPPQVVERLRLMVEVLSGKTTVSAAARALGMSRNHFQSILHRGLGAMIEEITPKAPGRPPKPEQLSALEAEIEQLRRENARLLEDVKTSERVLEVASGMLRERIGTARQSGAKKAKEATGEPKEEPEGRRRRRLDAVAAMRRTGCRAALAARAIGVHEATVRRWRARERLGEPLVRRACASASRLPSNVAQRASELVRALNGQVGAEALRRSVPGISRRQAARLKAETLTEMESKRKAALMRIAITVPHVMRGVDGMHLQAADGTLHALFAADCAVPYRTQVRTATRYDGQLVMRALQSDIERHGAPLVYRLDRARAHDVPAVQALLKAHEVMVLHGPPHCPRFYGQHERQNREHRAWADQLALLSMQDIEPRLEEMLEAVNKLWRRRTLQWRTAYEVWSARAAITIDRRALREEVSERAERIRHHMHCRGKPADLAERLAIEQALETRGYLRKEMGGWC